MKIRQAKKIMKQVYKTRYWAYRQGYYCGKKNGRVNHPEEHDIVKYTAISWYREEFVGGVDLGRNYMYAKYKFFELVVNKKYILEMKQKKNGNNR